MDSITHSNYKPAYSAYPGRYKTMRVAHTVMSDLFIIKYCVDISTDKLGMIPGKNSPGIEKKSPLFS